MSVWVTLAVALFATGGLIISLYLAVQLFFEGKRFAASPKVGMKTGAKEGSLCFYATWKPNILPIEFYRVKLSHFSPESLVKEGAISLTFDPPQKAPFAVSVELTEEFKDLLTAGQVGRKAVLMAEFKTIDGFVVAKQFLLAKAKGIYLGQAKVKNVPKNLNELPTVLPDAPAVSTLDYGELVARKKKLKVLADEAKKKAAKAPAKPAAPAPAAPAAAAPSDVPTT